jgi:uncharacterized membrane protein YdjX (TVP38/TMEM64 family)
MAANGCGRERRRYATITAARRGSLPAPMARVAEMLTTPRTSPARAALRRYGPPAFIVAVMAVAFMQGWHHQLTLENVVVQRDRFHVLLAEYPALSVLAYIAVYALAVTLSMPCGLILSVAGGLLFGWLVGSIAAIVGATLGATLVFAIARSVVGDTFRMRAGPWLAKLSEGFQKDALLYMLFLRLVPAFPFWFVNLAPALLGVPLKTFVLGTFLGIIPATLAFASAGAGLDSVIAAAKAEHAACVALHGPERCKLMIHASSFVTRELIQALILIGVVALIPVVIKNVKKWRKSHGAAQ